MPFKIIIVGSGLGGLACALPLAKQGHTVTLLEAASALTTIGGGISIPPNSTRVFRYLGLIDQLTAAAVIREQKFTIAKFRRYDNGEVICDASERSRDYGSEQMNIHRAPFQTLLKSAAEENGAVIHVDSRVVALDESGPSPAVITKDGRRFEGDLIIGADGAKSFIRQLKYPFIDLSTGWNCYRAVLPGSVLSSNPSLAPALCNANFWWGPQRVVAGIPLQGGASYSLELAHPGQTGSAGDWSKRGDKAEMQAMFADFEPVVRMLIEKVEQENLLVWKLVQLPELESWVWESGRVVLMGDAAHAVMPYAGQGHAITMEDSACLSLCLGRCISTADIPKALYAFETIRKPRTNMLASHALANAKLWQLPDGPEQVARDERLRKKAVFSAGDWDGRHVDEVPASLEDRLFYPWMFGHDVVDFTRRRLDEIWKT